MNSKCSQFVSVSIFCALIKAGNRPIKYLKKCFKLIRHQTESLDLALTIEFLLYSPKSRRTFYDFTVSRLEKGSTIKVVSPSSEVDLLSEGVLLSYIIDFENLERN